MASRGETADAPLERAESDYQKRVRSEVRYFQGPMGNLPLPEAFHYWTNKYLRPEVEKVYGASGVVEIYARECAEVFRATGTRRVLSIGSGRGENEVAIARRLLELGFEDFRIDCVELGAELCEEGRKLAAEGGVLDHLTFVQTDMNTWSPDREGEYAAVIANQILHHLCELESIFGSIKRGLVPGGRLVTRDMVGRNGHRCWPELKAVVDQIWSIMPKRYTYDHIFKAYFDAYPDRDNSAEGFEGIRSQDILPLLLEYFYFEKFVAFGGVLERLTGRAFGHNLLVHENEGDRVFVDLIYLINRSLIDSGAIKPTQIIATLSKAPVPAVQCGFGWTPEWCLRPPDR